MKTKSTREILVVDDEESMAQVLELTLKDLGYDVAVASSGAESVQKAAETNPDLVLMDIRLKGDMSGIEAASEIHSRFDIPVIYLTGYADEDLLDRAKITEPFGYLLKPFEKRELYMTIEVALYRHSTEKAVKENLARLSKKNRYETIVRTVTQRVHKSINLQDVLENAVDTLSRNVETVATVGIYLIEGEETVIKAYRGFTGDYIERAGRIPYPRGATWKSIIEGKLVYVADVDRDTVIGPAGRDMGIQSYLCMPIRYEDKPIGTLNIASFEKNAFNGEELKLLETVSQQVEIAVNNAKQAEAFRQSEERFRLLVEGVKDYAILMLDLRGHVVSWNEGVERIKGYRAEEIIGKHFSCFYPTEEIQRGKPEYALKKAASEGKFEEENWRMRKDGSRFWASVVITAVKDEGGHLRGFAKVTRDITERKKAEEVLQKSKEELELRVEERTTELARINKELEKEVAWHKQAEEALRESETRYRLVARATQDAIWDWDLITDTLWWNEGVKKIFGYSADEVGSYINWWYERIHPEDKERVASGLYACIDRSEEFWSDEYRYRRADGSYANVFDRGYLMYDGRGKPVRMVGAISDLTERKQAEEQVKKSLKEKEVLLKETHHRVKNNLQIVSSLLSLQSRSITGKAREKFRESQDRVKSMALIHEKLYQSEDLQGVDFKEYIKGLLNHLLGSYGVRSSVRLNMDIDNVSMNINKAVPCGLIVNELVSNALKHAFPGGKKGEIGVALKLDKGNYSMIISNNGVPFPEGVDFMSTRSLGLQLVCALTEQLKGTIELNRGSGTEFKMTFPAP